MAKKTAHGREIAYRENNNVRYTLMEDGTMLRQWRYEGRLERATIANRGISLEVFARPSNAHVGVLVML